MIPDDPRAACEAFCDWLQADLDLDPRVLRESLARFLQSRAAVPPARDAGKPYGTGYDHG
jgi:hypothetical protein